MNFTGSTFSSIDELNSAVVACRKCPRLVSFREKVLSDSKRYHGEHFWRKPITGFGDSNGRILVVGLAPAASGANRTGRVFTGDKSSDILVSALYKIGLSNQPISQSIDDGLQYHDLFLTLAVRCVPPENKPTRSEIENCLPYLTEEIKLITGTKCVVALGTIAFNSIKSSFKALGFATNGMKFAHGKYYEIGGIRLYGCYHPSPRNINTGRTSLEDIAAVLGEAYKYASS